jgi:hypothetical protein
MNFYLKILPQVVGYVSLTVAATWLLGCFVQIHLFGRTVIGVESSVIVRSVELGLFVYASIFAIYLLVKYIVKFRAAKAY